MSHIWLSFIKDVNQSVKEYEGPCNKNLSPKSLLTFYNTDKGRLHIEAGGAAATLVSSAASGLQARGDEADIEATVVRPDRVELEAGEVLTRPELG